MNASIVLAFTTILNVFDNLSFFVKGNQFFIVISSVTAVSILTCVCVFNEGTYKS